MKTAKRAIALAVVLSLNGSLAAAGQAQAPAPATPAFEVASVKPSDPNAPNALGLPLPPGVSIPLILPLPGRLTAQNVPLRLLVRTAYGVEDFQIVGGPAWQTSSKFDINAKSVDANVALQMPLMLRSLLADRFKLKVHTETREGPISALVLARSDGKLGPKMKPSTATCPDVQQRQKEMLETLAKGGPSALMSMAQAASQGACAIGMTRGADGAMVMHASGQSIGVLLALVGQFGAMKNVKDQTGLTGLYDWDLPLDMRMLLEVATQQLGGNLGAALGPDIQARLAQLPEGPTLQSVLQQDLGLKIESQKGPVEYLVIDSAELPTAD